MKTTLLLPIFLRAGAFAFCPQSNKLGSPTRPGFALRSTTREAISGTGTRSAQLIDKAKDFIYNASAFYGPANPDYYSEEFVFRGPFIGPLNKKDYLFTLDVSFQIYKAFPDISPNCWGFSIDPEDPNRVWFMVRNTGTFQNDITLIRGLPSVKATGKKIRGPPETFSITFDDDIKVKALTVGYVADRFEGNTGGLGAAFGIFKAIGVPLPAGDSLLYNFLGRATVGLDGYPKSLSAEEDIPSWWPYKERLADGMK